MAVQSRTFSNIQLRRGTSSIWASKNPILLDGEIGIETNTNKIKIGNGLSLWNDLAYFSKDAASTTSAGIIELATDAEVQTGTDTTRAVTPAGLSSRTATETRSGVVELATDAETQTGTSTTLAMTPSNLSARTATEIRSGIVELATNAETQTGTDTARVITPASLSSRVASTTATGIVELATDAETQTGTDSTRSVTPANIGAHLGIPTAIATGVYVLAATTTTGSSYTVATVFPVGRFSSAPVVVITPTSSSRLHGSANNITTSGFDAVMSNFSGASSDNRSFNWIAIQY